MFQRPAFVKCKLDQRYSADVETILIDIVGSQSR
jgi:hypothetical protein